MFCKSNELLRKIPENIFRKPIAKSTGLWYNNRVMNIAGVAQWQSSGIVNRRLQVRLLSPAPIENPPLAGGFSIGTDDREKKLLQVARLRQVFFSVATNGSGEQLDQLVQSTRCRFRLLSPAPIENPPLAGWFSDTPKDRNIFPSCGFESHHRQTQRAPRVSEAFFLFVNQPSKIQVCWSAVVK